MKHLLTLIFTLLIMLGYSQCDNGTNYYPSTIYTPSDNTWGSATSLNYAGEIIRVNVNSGDDYEFEEIEEISSVAGGSVQGYSLPLGARPKFKKKKK